MVSWALPGQEHDPVQRYAAILQNSLGYSRTFNPRNLEFYWYPLWGQTLFDLVANVPNLIVAPQFPIWIVPLDDTNTEVESDEDGDDPEEVTLQTATGTTQTPAIELHSNDDNDSIHEGISMALTNPAPDAKGVVVDFAILRIGAQDESQHKRRYGGWRITEVDIGLLVEVKRYPSRGLAGGDLVEQLRARIDEAIEDLIEQAGFLFLENTRRHSVLAIAAAGPYWCNATIQRADVKGVLGRISTRDPSYSEQSKGRSTVKWSNIIRLGLARSNDRLRTVHNRLVELGVLATPPGV
ncbi:hypothetical protein BDR04DRAFT_1164563 [Suillus decipiens]|nr:hypothetical protein BDR04DRAFT_1164563 [Suillus decipiens]